MRHNTLDFAQTHIKVCHKLVSVLSIQNQQPLLLPVQNRTKVLGLTSPGGISCHMTSCHVTWSGCGLGGGGDEAKLVCLLSQSLCLLCE